MTEEKYYQEIEHLIKRNEINKRARKLEEKNDTIVIYWQIGKTLVEAQGGSRRAKYGNELIKKWSTKLTEIYGKGYDYTNLSRFRKFYLCFPILGTACQLSWSYYRYLISIKNENKRNYYINLCIKNHLTVRELRKEIKSNSYERLIDKETKIDIITPTKYSITTDMKNPVIIPVKNEVISEHDLEINILANLDFFFRQLGSGFTYVGHQYKISDGKNNYYIDILLFNIKLNCYVCVELKMRKLKKEDKAQVEYYMKLVDQELKEIHHNHTIGIIITKESDEFIVNFVHQDDIVPLSYELSHI
mgnify:FL=1